MKKRSNNSVVAVWWLGCLTTTTTHGFVLPKTAYTSVGQQHPTFTSAHQKTTSTALFGENGLLMMKKGLKWILVPNAKQPVIKEPVVVSSSSSSAAASATTVVDPTAAVVTAAPPAVPVETLADAKSALEADAVLQILPQTEGTLDTPTAAASTSTASLDWDQLVQSVRDNHWSRMPNVVAETAPPSDIKAPLLNDILKENGVSYSQGTGQLLKEGGSNFRQVAQDMVTATGVALKESSVALKESAQVGSEFLREAAGTSQTLMKEGGAQYSQLVKTSIGQVNDVVQQLPQSAATVVRIDPALYQAIQEKVQQAPSQSLNIDEIKELLALDKVQIDTASLAAASNWNEFAASLAAVKDTLSEGGITWNDIVNAMNLKDTGAWYFASAFLLILFTLSLSANGGSTTTEKIILTEAAMPAAEPSTSAITAVVTEEVTKLKDATNAMYAQLNEMKQDKSTRAYEVATLKSELRTVTNRLDANIAEEKQLRLELEATQAQLDRETKSLHEQLDERVLAEEQLRTQLAATEKKLAKEVEKVKKAKAKAESDVKAAELQVQQLEEEKEQMQEELATMRTELESLKDRLAKSEAQNAKASKAVNGSASSRGTTTRGARANGAPRSTLPSTAYDDLSQAFFMSIAEPAQPVSQPPPRTAKPVAKAEASPTKRAVRKVLVKKVVAKKVATTAVNSDNNDWSHMTPSALKRKTVKELSAYLELKVSPFILYQHVTGHPLLTLCCCFCFPTGCTHDGKQRENAQEGRVGTNSSELLGFFPVYA